MQTFKKDDIIEFLTNHADRWYFRYPYAMMYDIYADQFIIVNHAYVNTKHERFVELMPLNVMQPGIHDEEIEIMVDHYFDNLDRTLMDFRLV